jgi:hypothetical protein
MTPIKAALAIAIFFSIIHMNLLAEKFVLNKTFNDSSIAKDTKRIADALEHGR